MFRIINSIRVNQNLKAMKRTILLLFVLCLTCAGFAQNQKGLIINKNKVNKFKLKTSNINTSQLSFKLENFSKSTVSTSKGQATLYNAPNGFSVMKKGAPDVLKFVASVIVPDRAKMEAVVTKSTYKEYSNVLIAPSKGNLYRNVNPDSIPYIYGDVYNQNKFFPETLVDMGSPYIIRDYRGQSVNVYPFQYNPVTKVLRVYTEIEVKVLVSAINGGVNSLTRTKPLNKVDIEFSDIYKRHFINYPNSKYTPLAEQGNLLIICNSAFLNDMQPLVNWKKLIGIPTEIVDVSTIGNTATAIKAYVTNYYNQKGLTFLLLVGDAAQVATNTVTAGNSDNAYGYIVGADSYPEVFVGRFSAETVAHVQTQVKKTIDYEKSPVASPAWHNIGISIASDQGAGIGHNGGESDAQHEDLIRTHLLGYNYTTVSQLYQNGTYPSIADVSAAINSGASVINYTGHGSETSWGTSSFSNTDVNSLTNYNMLPFIWSVGCVNGAFVNTTCFGEAWLRATNNNQPTGAIATLMSTINQSWAPPMTGQDEMNDILVETYSNNIKRTFGGISMNGCMYMNDVEGSAGTEMTDTWNLFGDPSLMVRTDIPQAMTVTHPQSIMLADNQLQVNCNVNNAFVSLTVNNEIIGTGTILNGSANISFGQLPTTDSITVAVTAYNYFPYFGKVAVLDFQYNLDAGIIEIIAPESNYNCTNINITPQVVLRNIGLNALNNVTINYKLDNGILQQLPWNGNLSSLSKDTIQLPAFNLVQGSHTYQVYTSDPNGSTDQNTANDTKTQSFAVQNLPLTSSFSANITNFCSAPGTVTFNNLSENALGYVWDFGDGQTSTEQNPEHIYSALGTYSVTLTTNAGICGQQVSDQTDYINVGAAAPQVVSAYNCGPASLTLQATASGTINWFSDAAGTTNIGTGNTYTTPYLNASTAYYAQSVVTNPVNNTGKPDSIGSGGYFGSATNQHYLIFDSYVPFKLLSVKVYAGSAGNRTVELRDENSTVLQTITANVPAGQSRITLNFDVPEGVNLELVGAGSPDLYRNNNNSAIYPYTLPGLLSIIESSASLSQYNTPGNYYYFYDWEVKENDCESAIVPVEAGIMTATPVSDFTYNVNGTSVLFTPNATQAASYLWYFGDGTSSTLANPTHVYTASGTFNVKLIVINPCGSDSITQTIVITTGISENNVFEASFSIFPNPASEKINISFLLTENAENMVKIYNSLGALVYNFKDNGLLKGKHMLEINTSSFKSGIYYLEFLNKSNKLVRKFFILN